MNMNGHIEHIGRVENVVGRSVFVKIISQSACGSCEARKACGLSESSEKIIEVETSSASEYAVGDEVMVSVRRRVGLIAVAIAYVAPLVVLVAVLAGAEAFGVSEHKAALASLCGVAVYYLLLWLFRERISDRVNFIIHKI